MKIGPLVTTAWTFLASLLPFNARFFRRRNGNCPHLLHCGSLRPGESSRSVHIKTRHLMMTPSEFPKYRKAIISHEKVCVSLGNEVIFTVSSPFEHLFHS